MTTKRTHGQCTCSFGTVYWVAPGQPRPVAEHAPDCPSLYPAQHEPDALTKLVRHLRQHQRDWTPPSDAWTEQALALISKAREEQRRAIVRAKNDGLERAAMWSTTNAPSHGLAIALSLRALKDPEP